MLGDNGLAQNKVISATAQATDSSSQMALEQLADAFKQSPQFGRQIKNQVCQGKNEIRIFVDGHVLLGRQNHLPKVRQVLQQAHCYYLK